MIINMLTPLQNCLHLVTVSHYYLIAREFATLKQDAKQSVDTYALKVTKARPRLMAEARRLAPAGMSPFEHAWSVFATTSLKTDLIPALNYPRGCCGILPRIPSASQKARGKQFSWNKPRQPHSDSHLCCSHFVSLSSSMDTLKRGRNERSNDKGRVRSTTPSGKPKKSSNNRNNSDNANNNRSINRNNSDANDASTSTTVVDNTCHFPGCKYPVNHVREDSGLRKVHLKRGYERFSC